MRRVFLTIAVLSVVPLSSNAAQAFDINDRFMISPFGGVCIPVGDFGDNDPDNPEAGWAKTGFDIGSAVEFGITEEFIVGGRFSYSRYGVDDGASDDEAFDAHWTVLEIFGAYGKFMFLPGRTTRPYVRGGLFLGKPKFDVDGGDESWDQDFDVALGLNGGVGVVHMIGTNIGIGIEADFAHLALNESDDDSAVSASQSVARGADPSGVRDPGGNIDRLAFNGFVLLGL